MLSQTTIIVVRSYKFGQQVKTVIFYYLTEKAKDLIRIVPTICDCGGNDGFIKRMSA